MPENNKEEGQIKKRVRKNIKRVPLDMQIADYEEIKAYLEVTGETVNGFIKRAIREAMERDSDKFFW